MLTRKWHLRSPAVASSARPPCIGASSCCVRPSLPSSATTLDLRSSVCIRLMDTSLHSHTLYLNTDWELPKTRWLDHELTPLPRPQLHAWAWYPVGQRVGSGVLLRLYYCSNRCSRLISCSSTLTAKMTTYGPQLRPPALHRGNQAAASVRHYHFFSKKDRERQREIYIHRCCGNSD